MTFHPSDLARSYVHTITASPPIYNNDAAAQLQFMMIMEVDGEIVMMSLRLDQKKTWSTSPVSHLSLNPFSDLLKTITADETLTPT